MPPATRRELIDRSDRTVSLLRQSILLAIPRAALYASSSGRSGDEDLMRKIDAVYTRYPFYGSRRITQHLRRFDRYPVNRKRVQRLMRRMGIEGIAPKHRTTTANPNHRIYPYLLRGLAITTPNQVWGTDITYIPLAGGHVYLVAIIDWFSRYVISWELSASLDTVSCTVALERALASAIPAIHNSDQGCQYTSTEYLDVLRSHPTIQISMDGRGRCMDNIFTERLWRSVKYEDVYLKQYRTIGEVRAGLTAYFTFYNHERLHQSLDYRTPAEIYLATAAKSIPSPRCVTITDHSLTTAAPSPLSTVTV